MKRSQIISLTESKSLWNYTLSPGWTEEEVQILKQALQYFGIGKWKKIMASGCLPHKTIGQVYMQTQRLIGQQSLGEFMGLQVDLVKIFQENEKKTGVLRKNNCIINTGDNMTKEQRKIKIEENRNKYGLTKEQLQQLKKPKEIKNVTPFFDLDEIEKRKNKYTTIEILIYLDEYKEQIIKKIKLLDNQDIAKQQKLNNCQLANDLKEQNNNCSINKEGQDHQQQEDIVLSDSSSSSKESNEDQPKKPIVKKKQKNDIQKQDDDILDIKSPKKKRLTKLRQNKLENKDILKKLDQIENNNEEVDSENIQDEEEDDGNNIIDDIEENSNNDDEDYNDQDDEENKENDSEQYF